jgi:hypothetical protein
MTVFRWVVGVIVGLLALGGIFGVGLWLAFESDLWLQRARTFRHLIWVMLLFWFNVEVWGRVAWTIWTWNRPH